MESGFRLVEKEVGDKYRRKTTMNSLVLGVCVRACVCVRVCTSTREHLSSLSLLGGTRTSDTLLVRLSCDDRIP